MKLKTLLLLSLILTAVCVEKKHVGQSDVTPYLIITAYVATVFLNRWLTAHFRRKYPDGMFLEGGVPVLVWMSSLVGTLVILIVASMEYSDSDKAHNFKIWNWFLMRKGNK